MTRAGYVPCAESDIPDGVRFHVPGRHQGQAHEVAYGGFGAVEHDDGAPYKRKHDRTTQSVKYYRLAR